MSDALSKILERPRAERLATGFGFTEGPLWHPDGFYYFVDIRRSVLYRLTPGKTPELVRTETGEGNGTTFDLQGRLVMCEGGNRRVTRTAPEGRIDVLVDRYEGKRLNSPNDLVFHSSGALYFTDPPFGLPMLFDDPDKAPVQGVYRVARDGTVTRLITDIKAPNGIAFSPDEKTLYVSDVDPKRAAWLAYDVMDDGTVANGRVFFDATRWRKDPFFGPDGFKVDKQGNIFGSQPGGLSVIAPDGTLLGTIETGRPTSNVAWGEDGHTLFITGGASVYRLSLTTTGTEY